MTEQENTPDSEVVLEHHLTIFDDWRSIGMALYMALLGYGVMVGIPVISSAWVSLLGFTEVEVGRVAGADLGGFALGSLITSYLIPKMSRRTLALAAIVISVAANGLCTIYTGYEEVLLLRIVAGIGSGLFTAVALANLGATSKPAKAFAILLFAFAFTQAGELEILPKLSMNGIYWSFVGAYLISIPFLKWVPAFGVHEERDIELDIKETGGMHHHIHKMVPLWVPWMLLATIFATYLAIGAYWTYIELASLRAGVSPEWISTVLVWGSFMSIAAFLVTTRISDRFGLSRPLIGVLLILAGVVSLMIGSITNAQLFLSVAMFNFLWFFIDVYQMGSMSNTDPSGRYVALVPGAQGLGQILGPNIAASLLSYDLGYDSVFAMCAISALVGMLVYFLMYVRLKRIIPALADAP